MIQQIQSPCDECSGTGEIINPRDRCQQCKGKKVLPDKKFLEVHIDKGMKGGQTITFRGESDQSPNAETGDVVIVVEEKPHDRFKRQENDLVMEQEIDLLTALAGGQFAVKHLDDRVLHVKVHPGEVIKHGEWWIRRCNNQSINIVRSGSIKVIHGQGMPSQRHHEPGDLYVKITIDFPESINHEAIPLLEKALPPRKPIEIFDKNLTIDEVEMDEVDSSSQARNPLRDDPMDEDGEEPRVQCANQWMCL
jgi:DnaJ homolog subfamily A member 2